MTCRLCGVGNPAAAHYCVNCGAILRPAVGASRANATTVGGQAGPSLRARPDDLPPLPGVPPAQPAAASPAAEPVDAAVAEPVVPAARTNTGGERMVAWVALGVLVVAAAFFLQRIVAMSLDPTVRGAPPATSSSSAAALLVASSPAAVEPAPVAEPAAARPAAPAVPGTPARAEAIRSEEVSAANAARALVPVRPSARPPAPTEEPIEPLPAVALPPAVAPDASTVLPPVVVAPQAPARSRWERMHDEIAACRGNFLEKFACEHRIRARYCDGWYGRADECPSGRTADYGN